MYNHIKQIKFGEKINNFILKMSQTQKIAMGIISSIGFFIIAYGIAKNITYAPFYNIDKTWFPWLVMISLIGFVWYKLLEEK